ncbi:glycoside hydrolase family 43 protein [Paenibacillus sp. WLX2291]|uniref:glycoside hydrolase family 43 protein n=1 Tax=Paenibacillus sp. WLX2291 TaxID=3296934 RepID=UPI0039843F58
MPAYNTAADVAHPQTGHLLSDIPAHDPFILADHQTHTYYLYTGGAPWLNGMERYGVLTYTSTDLQYWEGPHVVFTIPDDTWAHPQHGAWAPEVHEHEGKYYLFVTLHNKERMLDGEPIQGYDKHWRGTVIAVSDSPAGPFLMNNSERPIVPETMMTLDGTLYRDEHNDPWMVYCHEWVQTIDGAMEAVRLNEDWSAAVGKPMPLFSGSAAPWLSSQPSSDEGIQTVHSSEQAPQAKSNDSNQLQQSETHHSQDVEHPQHNNVDEAQLISHESAMNESAVYVTDGCQLYRTSGGNLVMLWSSYENDSYVQTIARSVSGKLEGPWEQLEPLVKEDSGHGMLFQTFDGQWKLILHRPFPMPESRCLLFDMEDTGDSFRLAR